MMPGLTPMKRRMRFGGMVSRRLETCSEGPVVGVEGVVLLRDWDFFLGDEEAERELLVVGNNGPDLGRRDLPIP
jgi:hypothetical protein